MKRNRKPMRIIAGEYSEQGYAVLLCSGTRVHTLYTADNHPQDSQVVSPTGVSLRRIRTFCIRTCRKIAGEHRALFGGVNRHPTNA